MSFCSVRHTRCVFFYSQKVMGESFLKRTKPPSTHFLFLRIMHYSISNNIRNWLSPLLSSFSWVGFFQEKCPLYDFPLFSVSFCRFLDSKHMFDFPHRFTRQIILRKVSQLREAKLIKLVYKKTHLIYSTLES